MGTEILDESSRSLGRRGASMASFIMIGKIVAILFTGLSLILVARLLGPSTYGIYTLAMGVIGLGQAFGLLTGSTINKLISEYRGRREVKKIGPVLFNAFVLVLVVNLAIALVIIALSGAIAQSVMHSTAYAYVISFAAVSIVFTALYDSAFSTLVGFGKAAHAAYVTAAFAVIQMVGAVGLALLGFGALSPILGYILACAAGSVTVLYIVLMKIRVRIKPRLSRQAAREVLVLALPLTFATIFGSTASYIGITALGVFSTAFVAGNFGIVFRINSGVMDIVVGAIFTASISMFSMALTGKRSRQKVARLYDYALYIALLLLAPVLIYIAALAVPFSYTVFSGYYSLAPLYLGLACVGIIIGLPGNYAKTLLFGAGRAMELVKYGLVTTVLEIVAILLLVPRFNGLGLVISVFYVATLSDTLLFSRRIRDTMGVRIQKPLRLLKVVAANAALALILFALSYVLKGINIPLLLTSVVVGILLYPMLLGITGAVKKTDLATIEKVSKGIPVVEAVARKLSTYTSRFSR